MEISQKEQRMLKDKQAYLICKNLLATGKNNLTGLAVDLRMDGDRDSEERGLKEQKEYEEQLEKAKNSVDTSMSRLRNFDIITKVEKADPSTAAYWEEENDGQGVEKYYKLDLWGLLEIWCELMKGNISQELKVKRKEISSDEMEELEELLINYNYEEILKEDDGPPFPTRLSMEAIQYMRLRYLSSELDEFSTDSFLGAYLRTYMTSVDDSNLYTMLFEDFRKGLDYNFLHSPDSMYEALSYSILVGENKAERAGKIVANAYDEQEDFGFLKFLTELKQLNKK